MTVSAVFSFPQSELHTIVYRGSLIYFLQSEFHTIVYRGILICFMNVSVAFFLPLKRVAHHCVLWKFDLFPSKRVSHHCVPWNFDLFHDCISGLFPSSKASYTPLCTVEVLIYLSQASYTPLWTAKILFDTNPPCRPLSPRSGFYDFISSRFPPSKASYIPIVLEYRPGLIIILIPPVNLHFRVWFHYIRSSILEFYPPLG